MLVVLFCLSPSLTVLVALTLFGTRGLVSADVLLLVVPVHFVCIFLHFSHHLTVLAQLCGVGGMLHGGIGGVLNCMATSLARATVVALGLSGTQRQARLTLTVLIYDCAAFVQLDTVQLAVPQSEVDLRKDIPTNSSESTLLQCGTAADRTRQMSFDHRHSSFIAQKLCNLLRCALSWLTADVH